MKKSVPYFIFIAILFSSFNTYAQSAHKLNKIGEELESRGLYQKAADYYCRCLNKKPDDVKAITSLERTAPKVIDALLKDFTNDFNNENYESAVQKYESAVLYKGKVKRYGVSLDIPKPYTDNYSQSKEILAEKYYSKGEKEFNNGTYQQAVQDLTQCLAYEPDYKDAGSLLSNAKDAKNVAEAEKYYKSGVSELNNGNYHGAYKDFGTCLSYKSGYKDADNLRNEALQKGMVRIGIFRFKNDTRYFAPWYNQVTNVLYDDVVSDAVNNKSPFITVVDRNNLSNLLQEQKLEMSGMVNQSTATKAGRLLGLNYVVIGSLINVTKTGGNFTSKRVNCYSIYSYRASDGKIFLGGRPTYFTLYEASTTVTFKAKFEVISVQTGEIVSDKVVSASASDHVKFARYSGDYSKLSYVMPGHTILGKLATAASRVNQKLFTSERRLKTPEEMETPIINDLAWKIEQGICSKFE